MTAAAENAPPQPTRVPADRSGRLWWVVVAPTLGVTLGSLIITLSWAPRLPAEVANQWGGGAVTTVRPLWVTVVPLALMSLAWIVGILVMELTGRLTGWGRRLNTGLLAGINAFIAATPPVLLYGQLDLSSPWDAPDPFTGLAVLTAVAACYGLAAAVAVGDRPLTADPDQSRPVERLPLAESEDAVWTRTTTAWVFVLLAATGGALLVVGVVSSEHWPLALLGAVLLLLGTATSRWTVTVDRSGLHCRTFLGIMRFTYPAHPEATADATEVGGLAEFLGWGIRFGRAGSIGLIFRNGPALRVREPGGRSLTITVDDPATAAALFNTQAGRAAPRP